MDNQVLTRLIAPILIASIFLILVFVAIKTIISSKNERRVKNFALDSKDEGVISIADGFLLFCLRIIKWISKGLSKSQVFKDYAKKMEKYIISKDDSSFSSMDYMSLKILVMIGIQFLYLISITIKYNSFNAMVFLLGSIISFFIVDVVILVLYKNRNKLIEEQLLQAVVMMNSAFKSGKNILQAIEIVKKEMPSPLKDEFEIIYKDLTYGLDLSTVFERFYKRVKLEEAKYITASLSLLSKTGGNIVTVFNMIEKSFYDRLKIKNELEAMTSSSRFLYRMLTFMPIIFVVVIVMMNPSYFNPLLTTSIGYIIDVIILVLYLLYLVMIKRIMRVEEV